MKNKGRSNHKSLCHKSMKMVTNIVNRSSSSIAKTHEPAAAARDGSASNFTLTGSPKVISNRPPLVLSRFIPPPEEPTKSSSSKPVSYLHVGGMGSLYVIQEDHGVDGKASDYIRRVRDAEEPTKSCSLKPVSNNLHVGGMGSLYVIQDDSGIDGKASDYIRRVREKNQHDSNFNEE